MKTNKIEFVDAQQMHLEHPKTFEVPDEQELDAIDVGSIVKVSVGGERFWTTVVAVEDNKITASIDNDLVCTDEHGLDCGNIIEYEKRNVYSIW